MARDRAQLVLTAADEAMLHGTDGEAVAFAMRILVAFARALGARSLLDISGAHIDGCLYHGQASLDFVERLVAAGGRVRVPTTLNVGAIDLLHPELVRLREAERTPAQRLMRAHEALGCEPSFTCAPYQTRFRPSFGQQIAWGESNAIVFANSVIGARTNRYGDFIDLCCAITGRAPAWGLHLDEGRRGEVLFRLRVPPSASGSDDPLFTAIGLIIGRRAGDRVPVIDGLPHSATEDQLKALGAAAATTGSVGLFHAVGITPEASTLDEVFRGEPPVETIDVTEHAIRTALRQLSTVSEGVPISAVCLGTPHFSRVEWDQLITALERSERPRVRIYVNTGRATLAALEADAALARLEGANLVVVTDTCTYLTPILERLDGAIMTNSGKWAHYAPGNIGVQVAFGSLDDCVASAVAGRVTRIAG